MRQAMRPRRVGRGWRRTLKRGGLVIGVAALWMTVACPLVSASEVTIGYVDMVALFDKYQRTQRSESILEQQGKTKESELTRRLDELRRLREGLDLLSDEARDARVFEIEERADALKRFGKHTKLELARERDRVAQGIIEDIQQTVKDYAKDHGFSLILDERLLLYGQEGDDLTEAILTVLNANDTARADGPRQR